MMQRCYDPLQINYVNYGGRGISVCERWKHFRYFAEDMGIRPSAQHSLDRINVDGNYEFSNCRWATRGEQNSNKRIYKTNNTGVSGITRRNSKFQVRVVINSKRKSLGNYETLQKAINARKNYFEKEIVVG